MKIYSGKSDIYTVTLTVEEWRLLCDGYFRDVPRNHPDMKRLL
jgi:hypothetical protein